MMLNFVFCIVSFHLASWFLRVARDINAAKVGAPLAARPATSTVSSRAGTGLQRSILPRPSVPRRLVRTRTRRSSRGWPRRPQVLRPPRVDLRACGRRCRLPPPLLPLQLVGLAPCKRTCRLLPRRLQPGRPVTKRSLPKSARVVAPQPLSKLPPPLLVRMRPRRVL